MKKITKNQVKIIKHITSFLIAIIIGIIIGSIITNNIITNKGILKEKYQVGENTNSNLLASYIEKGVTIGGVTGTLEILDTSDADAVESDILKGKTAYVNGKKITGTLEIESPAPSTPYIRDNINGEVVNQNTEMLDDLENKVVVPKGFKIAADSATKVEDGVVIQDSSGNQFVWIPAMTATGYDIHTTLGDKRVVYERTDWGKNDGDYKDYGESMAADEQKSVDLYGGFYIGRYEAGDRAVSNAKRMREEGDSQSNTVSIKKGQAPYNYITASNAKKAAEAMSSKYGYAATTKIASSYAWDTALSLIQIKNSDYATNSQENNYDDTSFSYKDINGTTKSKKSGESILVPTGQTTPVCNIYDMGGNIGERNYEQNDDSASSGWTMTNRGGWYYETNKSHPAGDRFAIDAVELEDTGFRVALFI